MGDYIGSLGDSIRSHRCRQEKKQKSWRFRIQKDSPLGQRVDTINRINCSNIHKVKVGLPPLSARARPSPQSSSLTISLPPLSGQPSVHVWVCRGHWDAAGHACLQGAPQAGVRAGHRNCKASHFCGDSLRTGCHQQWGSAQPGIVTTPAPHPHSSLQTRPHGSHLTDGETKAQRCQEPPGVLELVSDRASLSGGLLPGATRLPPGGSGPSSTARDRPEAGCSLHGAASRTSDHPWGGHPAHTPICTARKGPCQGSRFALQLYATTPPLVRKRPSSLRDQLSRGLV